VSRDNQPHKAHAKRFGECVVNLGAVDFQCVFAQLPGCLLKL
jgi:hypothetical protein